MADDKQPAKTQTIRIFEAPTAKELERILNETAAAGTLIGYTNNRGVYSALVTFQNGNGAVQAVIDEYQLLSSEARFAIERENVLHALKRNSLAEIADQYGLAPSKLLKTYKIQRD